MLNIIDITHAGIETLDLAKYPGHDPAKNCSSCAVWRPGPQLDGNLQVDPEIVLPSPGMNVEVGYFYNSNTNYNGPFGYGRTITPNLTAVAQVLTSPTTFTLVTLTRGNGAVVSYSDNGTGTFVPQTVGVLNALVMDTTNSYWRETTPSGIMTAYPLNTTAMLTTIAYAQDAIGNAHTFSYLSSGLLSSITDAVGRNVSFSYNGSNLLSTIEDWAGRLTTFTYGTADSQNVLTNVQGPTGCNTQYSYDGSARLTSITDPNGYQTTYAYDSQSRVLQRYVAGAGLTAYTYTSSGLAVTNALSHITTNSLGISGTLLGLVDPLGHLTTFARANGQEVSRQNPLGHVSTINYGGGQSFTVLSMVDPLGRTTTYLRDIFNNPTTMVYADGSISTLAYGYSGSSFDTTGTKRKIQVSIDQLGYNTTFAYNGRGQLQL
jgi:YD repeat-containing protein